MKRKGFVILGVFLGAVALILVVIWPAAPLWERLGFTPICIQGAWPDLRVVSCPQTAASPAMISPPQLTAGKQGPIPIIVDDDGSPDGMVALLYFLRSPLFDVKAVTISCSEAHPDVFAPRLQRLLAGLGRPDIPVGEGRSAPLEGTNAFPDPWRQASDKFWGLAYPEATTTLQPVAAAELIVDTIKRSNQPLTVFVSGTHTNLTEALRLDPGIVARIRDVYVMGGSIHVPGNIQSDWSAIDNRVAEWNIWVDPSAAHEVFASGLKLHLIPLDATERVLWTESDAHRWMSSGSREGVLAGVLLNWMLASWNSTSVYVWDLVAAVQTSDPAMCSEIPLSLDVILSPAPNQGQTVVTNQSPNVNVCLTPDAGRMRALADATLGR
jgi:pyrimidine-specific ribonucleoside hydrolase